MMLSLVLAATLLAAAPTTPRQRAYSKKMQKKRARMEKICKAQGPTCHVGQEKGAPRDLMGVSCICD